MIVKLISFVFIALVLAATSVFSANGPCESWKSVPITSYEKDDKGNIVSQDGVTYHPKEVYYETDSAGENKMRGCPCIRNPCIRKCCPHDQVYVKNANTNNKATCVPNDGGHNLYDRLAFYALKNGENPEKVVGANETVVAHKITDDCENKKMFFLEDDEYYLLNNGSLLKTTRNADQSIEREIVTIDNYCVDLFNNKVRYMMCVTTSNKVMQNNPSNYPDGVKSAASKAEALTIMDVRKVRLILYPVCMLSSLPFLVATCLLYSFIPDLNNLVGKSLSSLTFTRIMLTPSLCILQLFGKSAQDYCLYLAGFLIGFLNRIFTSATGSSRVVPVSVKNNEK